MDCRDHGINYHHISVFKTLLNLIIIKLLDLNISALHIAPSDLDENYSESDVTIFALFACSIHSFMFSYVNH